MSDKWQTRMTLIERARDPNDSQAWQEFVDYYREFIRMLLNKLGVDRDDVEDLTQDILLKLWNALPDFRPSREDVKFRTWMGAVVRNTVWKAHSKRSSREKRESQVSVPEVAPNDLESMIEREWKDHVSTIIMKRLPEYFSGKAIDVFTMTLKGKSADEIASNLGIKTHTVYVLRNRVKARFLREANHIRHELGIDW